MTAPLRIVIVGGGTAGWMAANLMAAAWPQRASVTLVESPDVATIGVGEGSTPHLKAFFDRIGLAERDWMPRCRATWKLGIRFDGWSQRPGAGSYFHPFPAQSDSHVQRDFVLDAHLRRQGMAVPADPDAYLLNATLAEQRCGPHPAESFPFPVHYGYHFDAGLLGTCLAEHGVAKGVAHVRANVTGVARADNGDVRALHTDRAGDLEADLFVDCTGFAGVLVQKTLGVGFRSFADNMFNDAAVVLPTPAEDNPKPQTGSTALSAGWCWSIPLTHRTGNGYVHSSAHIDADAAETELRAHLGLLDADVEARHLKMRVGQLTEHWAHNVVAVGLAQGFIEPLEATALHLAQFAVESFISDFEQAGFTPGRREQYNQRMVARFEGVRDYIVGHYRVSDRTDTEYWRANSTNEVLSGSLKGVLGAWLEGQDVAREVLDQDIGKYYSVISWHCLLAGYGLFPERLQDTPMVAERLARQAEVREFVRRCALNFPSHAEALAEVSA